MEGQNFKPVHSVPAGFCLSGEEGVSAFPTSALLFRIEACFREKETHGRMECVDMYGNISEDESISVAEINKDFKSIDPKLNKADVKQDADGRRVRFAKLLDQSIDWSEKYSWIRIDELPMYNDKGAVEDVKHADLNS